MRSAGARRALAADACAAGPRFDWLFRRAGVRRPVRSADRQPDRLRELKAGEPAERVGRQRSRDPDIQGFATDISVDRGRRSASRSRPTATDYRLDIYRLGYYGGDGRAQGRDGQPIGCAAADAAGLPHRRRRPAWSTAATGRCRPPGPCRRRRRPASTSPSSCATDTGGASHIVFIVRDDDEHSDLLFQTSDTTWQAYNSYGGNSLYVGGRPGRAAPTRSATTGRSPPAATAARGLRSSTPSTRWCAGSRPTATTSATRPASTPTAAAPSCSAAQGLPVGRPRRVLVGRPARERRGGARRRRATSRSSAATRSSGRPAGRTASTAPARPTARWSATRRPTPTPRSIPNADLDRDLARSALQPAGRRRPARERADRHDLHGQRPAPTAIQVPAADGKMRFWRNTQRRHAGAGPDRDARRRARSATSGTRTSTTASARPGLIRLSSTTVNGVRAPAGLRLDLRHRHRDPPPDALSRTPSGALVFGAGTVQWSWGLDGNHDRGGAGRRPRMQQATVNLFADMGVQPAHAAGRPGRGQRVDRHARRRRRRSPSPTGGRRRGRRAGRRSPARPTDAAAAQVGGVEVSVDGGATWHPATGRENWTYSWTPGAHRHRRRSEPRGRRQRQHREPGGRRSTVDSRRRRAARARSGAARRHRSAGPRRPARSSSASSSAPTSPASSPASASTRPPATPAPTSATSGRRRAPSSARRPSPARPRPAGSRSASARRSRSPPTPPTSPRTTPRTATTPSTDSYFAASGVDNPPLHALADGVDGANGVYNYGAAALFPTEHLQRRELLGRRRLRHDVGPTRRRRRSARRTPPAARPASTTTRRHRDLQRGDGRGDDQRRERRAPRRRRTRWCRRP